MKLKTEPVEAAEVPPEFNLRRDEETADENRSIPELIDDLRTAFKRCAFDRVQDILMEREDKLKRDIEKRKEEYELTRDSLGIARLQQREAEEELKSFKAKFVDNVEALCEKAAAAEERAKSAEESARRSEQMYEKLLREVKKAESEKSSDLAELHKKNGELESAKARAEEELKVSKRRFAALEERVTKLEAEIIQLESKNAENGAGPTILITDSDDDCAPGATSSEKESSPRVLKRKRLSSENVNEDEDVAADDSISQDQGQAVEIGGSSGNPDSVTVASATSDPENQNILATNRQMVSCPLEANGAPKTMDLSRYHANHFGDEFDEFKVTSSSSDSDSE